MTQNSFDLDADIVELIPFVREAETVPTAPLAELAFRVDAWLPDETNRLRAAFAALRAGGILAVWSAYPSDAFGRQLEAAGFSVEELTLPAYTGSEDQWHTIWFAKKP